MTNTKLIINGLIIFQFIIALLSIYNHIIIKMKHLTIVLYIFYFITLLLLLFIYLL